MKIRLASTVDAESISNLTRSLVHHHISQDLSPEGRQSLDDALSKEAICKYMAEDCRFHVAVGKDDNLLGIVAMRENRHLLLLFVADEAQGKGISRLLWETAKSASHNAGYNGTFTVSAARDAIAIYKKFGFRVSGEETEEHGVVRTLMLKPAERP